MKNLKIFENKLIEEILSPEELSDLVESNTPLKHYIGFEISGKPHIGSVIITMGVIKDLIDMGSEIVIFLADWHSWINNKLGGDIDLIKKVANGFFKEAMIGGAKCLGIDPAKIKFVLGSDLYIKNPEQWANVINASQHLTLARVRRGINIMGRREGEDVNFATLIYPPLQVADIFTMQRNIIHAGTDQRKAHVMARMVANKMTVSPLQDSSGKIIKPVAIHQKLLPSILPPPKWPITVEEVKEMISGGDLKMSKSKPDGAIFINDTPEDILKKVSNAFCPAADLSYNPVVIWAELLVFALGNELHIKRPEKWGGNLTIKTIDELKDIFLKGGLHPQDLKQAMAEYIIDLTRPAYDHLNQNAIKEVVREMNSVKITR